MRGGDGFNMVSTIVNMVLKPHVFLNSFLKMHDFPRSTYVTFYLFSW